MDFGQMSPKVTFAVLLELVMLCLRYLDAYQAYAHCNPNSYGDVCLLPPPVAVPYRCFLVKSVNFILVHDLEVVSARCLSN